MKNINEFLGFGKSRLHKILDALEIEHWNDLHTCGQSAITTLIDAIDHIEDNYNKFGKYESTENAIRDAINSALEQGGYSKFLTIE
jgi:hypothetical protein